MNWDSPDVQESFRLYKHKLSLYITDEKIREKSDQALKILRSIGDEGLKKLYGSSLSDDDQKDPDKLYAFFESQIPKSSTNFRVDRLQLMRQFAIQKDESIDEFVTRVRRHAKSCKFTENELQERIIELVIATTPYPEFQKELLGQEQGFTVNQLLELGRKHEVIQQSGEKLKQLNFTETANVNVEHIRRVRANNQNKSSHDIKNCKYCGGSHARKNCPAFKNICELCNKRGHYKKMCLSSRPHNREKSRHSKQRQKRQSESVQCVEQNHYAESLDTIKVSTNVMKVDATKHEVFTKLDIIPPGITGRKFDIKLKLDTGASGNTLPLRIIKKIYGENYSKHVIRENVKLTAYNGKTISYKGSIHMNLVRSHKEFRTKFYIIDVPEINGYRVPAILGLPSCEELGLITINDLKSQKSTQPLKHNLTNLTLDALKAMFPESFDAIGNIEGKVKLHLKDNAEPFIAAPRKCSIHMKDKIKAELDNMEDKGIIRKVNEHTDWCSNVCFVTKSDNSLRVCLDPKKLNENLKRCPHKVPTTEELNPLFSGAKYFSKLDAKAGYWSLKLDESSQLLTTFRSPLGQRYCYNRLPFGLNVSQDEYQKKMDEVLENMNGVASIADDVCVTGKTEEEHDQNLLDLMKRASQKGLVFNSKKCDIKKSSISFFGNVYTKDGIKPDPKKVSDIQGMPSPTNKDELRRFLGMITYLSQFIPKYSDKTAILRDLIKESNPWCWEDNHEEAYNSLKGEVTEKSLLSYLDVSAHTTLEVDASTKGLGAAIIQNGKPVAFASKALTDTQSRYSNIEREMLAIVFGCERFHTLLYGKSFSVVTDHKPLVTITCKNILAAPARLQRMLLRVQGYNFNVTYRPGSQMILADALSRLPNEENKGSFDLDNRIDFIDIEINTAKLVEVAMINLGSEKKKSIKEETPQDPVLNALKELVYNGWPNNIKELSPELRSYWSCRDEIAIESGVLFKGKQVIIPESMRPELLNRLHQSHQGIDKTRRLSRESVYWPNINKEIEKVCKNCTHCQEYQHNNKKAPMIPHELPSKPWQYIASDLFEIEGKQFLITADKYSKLPLVEEMAIPVTSNSVAQKIKQQCALFGKPERIFTDNGPQYTGQAFKSFISEWGITHITSSPTYSQSNGFIERQIGHIKPLLKKTIASKGDIQITLLNIRATPIDEKLKSPAELMFERPITTLLPSHHNIGHETDRESLQERRDYMMRSDKSSLKTAHSILYPGQFVRVLSHRNNKWFPGTIVQKDDNPESYLLKSNGRMLRRNRNHIRETPQEPAQNQDNTVDRNPDSTVAHQQIVDKPESDEPSKLKSILGNQPKPIILVDQPQPRKAVTVTFAEPIKDNVTKASVNPSVKKQLNETGEIQPRSPYRTRSGRVVKPKTDYNKY